MQNYTFSSKPPRIKQRILQVISEIPEICEIPNRTGQDLRPLRNLRDPTLNDRIGQKTVGASHTKSLYLYFVNLYEKSCHIRIQNLIRNRNQIRNISKISYFACQGLFYIQFIL